MFSEDRAKLKIIYILPTNYGTDSNCLSRTWTEVSDSSRTTTQATASQECYKYWATVENSLLLVLNTIHAFNITQS